MQNIIKKHKKDISKFMFDLMFGDLTVCTCSQTTSRNVKDDYVVDT